MKRRILALFFNCMFFKTYGLFKQMVLHPKNENSFLAHSLEFWRGRKK